MAKQRVRKKGKHGRTFCGWCNAKIARGMQYCNPQHRARADNYRRASQPVKEDVSVPPVEVEMKPIRKIPDSRVAAIYKGITPGRLRGFAD